MKNQPGYPLPDGELGEDDIVCQLVYLPDRPEYWQAFYAALHYMTTWKAWERDDDNRGKDAATNWRAAFELTSGCWRMTCLEQLQDDVAEILAIMQLGNPCCDDMDITDGDQYTDRVEDGVGDVPQNIIDAGYAEDAADWDGFDDYKCMIVHVTVNQMSARLNELNELTNEYGAIAGSAAAVFAILAVIFGTGGLAIVFGIVAGVGAVSLLYEALMGFELLGGLADKVDTNHDEIACAMYDTDGDEAALVALNDKIDELFTSPEAIILKNLNNGPTLKSLYAGRYDQQDIAEILYDAGYDVESFDCDCEEHVGEFYETFHWPANDDWLGWDHASGDSLSSGNPDYAPELRYGGPTGFIDMDMDTLAALIGVANPSNRRYKFWSVTWQYKMDSGLVGTCLWRARTTEGSGWTSTGYANKLVWTDAEKEWGESGREIQYTGDIRIGPTGGSGNYMHIDNVTLDFDSYLV